MNLKQFKRFAKRGIRFRRNRDQRARECHMLNRRAHAEFFILAPYCFCWNCKHGRK